MNKLSIEIQESAYKLAKNIINVQPKERVVITADTGSDWRVVEATANAIKLLNAKPMVIWYPMPPYVGKAADNYLPMEPLKAALKNADVWIEFNKSWLLYSTPWDDVMAEKKVKYLCLVGMDGEMIVRNIGMINVNALFEFQKALADITINSKMIEIKSPAGMNVKFENDPERPVFTEGIIKGPGDYMLFGQVDWAPVEYTINGTIVFDGSVWPPGKLGLLKHPIFLEVREGKVTKISGGWEAMVFKKWLKSFNDENMFNVAHISYGCNPGAKLTGNILEDERVWGVVEWGLGNQAESFRGLFGPAKTHTDGICLAPTMKGDGNYIIRDGEYVHPKLVNLQKKLLE